MRWLERRGPGFYCVLDVPRSVRAAMGRKRLVKSLGTRDHHVALARRHSALTEFYRLIAEARSQATASPIVVSALEWRRHLEEERRRTSRDGYDDDPHAVTVEECISDEAERIEVEHGLAVAQSFFAMATGKETPLLHYVDAWLAEGGPKGPLRERTKHQYRADLAALEVWTRTADVPPTIEAFTRTIAGRYVTQALAHLDRGTANRKISAPSSYWRWLVKRGHCETNPWQNQSLAKGRIGARAEEPKRPFTDAEVASLLAGDADQELSDLMHVAALSGMRLDEHYRLRVSDCGDGWFDLRRAKTSAGRRRVPIHTALSEIIARRTKGKPAAAFLFHEAGPERPNRERSMAASKRFGKYRQRCGVHEAREGARQSRIDFHSFRRWFVTKARDADFDRAVVAAIVGHEAGNLTDDVYSGGPSAERMRACVEAVRLPALEPPGLSR